MSPLNTPTSTTAPAVGSDAVSAPGANRTAPGAKPAADAATSTAETAPAVVVPTAEATVANGTELLAGRKILVTGVLTNRSLAYRAAVEMQQMGAELTLTGHGRARRITERAAQTLPSPPPVLELDVSQPEHFARLAAELGERWERLDGVLHSIAFAPPELFSVPFAEVPLQSIETAMRCSTYSLRDLLAPLLGLLGNSPGGASVLALTVLDRAALNAYAWMAVIKAALDGLVRQLAMQLAGQGTRVNLLACGPVRTNAGSAIPGLDELAADFRERAPLGWDERNFGAIAGPACFMLSDLARLVTGEILHVDGGRHIVL